jgi:hypothetical protein
VETLAVECLRCGEQHQLESRPKRSIQDGECPRCGYVGWAYAAELTEPTRRALRDHPVERRVQLVA